MSVVLSINGRERAVDAAPMTPLLAVLRDELHLTGAKLGCGEGRCGACTILLDDEPVVACLLPLALAEGRAVRTVEGLTGPEQPLSPLQDALLEHGGVQCGACTPGIAMSLTALLERDPDPDEAAVQQALAGNICRCTGYRKIVDAALSVAAGQRA
ncbi:(2Fe-2S)-binding protein [Conexibacter woesei]|uniref:(2Fe-2S)-binding domain protein n=1 Tax=Conexibacter woesei (strain DSM 14684 / CCUG 47730 / CIP 108061 / JCM 11494 / NBRC 100937 / ID131577) TaxID=469383 RepID=D3F4S2_CONWI|nr:(2Fe-2S)-binding protein [Conexibacter woesei]ADB52529.1 (2Fe-2S)-binding domain protein [Conexibacter woesei DSM 14684]